MVFVVVIRLPRFAHSSVTFHQLVFLMCRKMGMVISCSSFATPFLNHPANEQGGFNVFDKTFVDESDIVRLIMKMVSSPELID